MKEQTEYAPLNRILGALQIDIKTETKDLQKKIEKEQNEKWTSCPFCNGTGWIETENNTFKKCECITLIANKEMWQKSEIAFEDIDKSFKNFSTWNEEMQKMKDVATNYFLRFEGIKSTRVNSILFSGNPGTGKTHLSLALANNFMNKKHIGVIYMSYRDILTKLKQSMLDKENYSKELNKYKNAEILLIDDLFKGKITESDINIIFEILNYRYLKYLPCIISTEKTTDELLKIDEAVGSRIIESCKDYISQVLGQENNYRLKK